MIKIKKMISFFLFFIYFQLILAKNVVFPFKKLTIEYLNETKTISDFIDFNIYSNISMGSPRKKVGHFIKKRGQTFYYDNLQLHYHSSSEYDNIQKEIENKINIYYFSANSSTFEEIDDWYGIYSDIYYL